MASLNVELALANDRDARPLALLARDLIESGLGWGYRPSRIAALIRDTDTVTLVARTHAQPIGFAVMRFGDERAHLILLAVEREHQRRGIGRRLIEWLLESAYVAGIASVHIELRAANAFPPVGTRTVECAQGRSNLECVEEVKATPNPLFRRVEVRVYHGAVRSHMLAELIGILPRR